MLVLWLLVPLAAAAYPLGAGRYGRSLGGWPPLGVYYPPRTTRPYYYLPQPQPQDPYYYPVVPNYYQRPYYYGYDEVSEPLDDQEDLIEEDERGDGDESAYGQETYYGAGAGGDLSLSLAPRTAYDDVNARFLQNLILAQMYSDADKLYGDENGGDIADATGAGGERSRWVYGEPVKSSKGSGKGTTMSKEDEDVRELKSLVRGAQGGDKKKKERRERRERSDKTRKSKESPFAEQLRANDWDEFRSSSYKRSNDGKTTPTTSRPTAASASGRGQKEEVMLRPPSPPARSPLHQDLQAREGRARQPSVFDTIKKLLHMEEQLEEKNAVTGTGSGLHVKVQKRSYIPSEDALVAELGGLKKMA